jgi:hypothetical protein
LNDVDRTKLPKSVDERREDEGVKEDEDDEA